MPRFEVLVGLLMWALPCVASAQPWVDAYQAGEYKKAAALLQALVIDPEFPSTASDPTPSRQLAVMYAKGLGVPRDPIAACMLAQMAEVALHIGAPRYANEPFAYLADQKESERFKTELCGGLSRDDVVAATLSMGCPAFGMPEEVLSVGGHSVRVGRGGIRLADAPVEQAGHLPMCPVLIAQVATRTIMPPSDAAPGVKERHFVELFSWRAGRDAITGELRYVLLWQPFEVQRNGVGYSTEQELEVSHVWPAAAERGDLTSRVSLEMIRSGHMRWRISGAPPRQGWIMGPEERQR